MVRQGALRAPGQRPVSQGNGVTARRLRGKRSVTKKARLGADKLGDFVDVFVRQIARDHGDRDVHFACGLFDQIGDQRSGAVLARGGTEHQQ